ncbi:hypothetical protein HYY73_02035 [Candidatus Woesearchaeota archaeon]|nr:hypothetical protein [Candidatus Woesearchaeota archaeon]
MEARYKQVGLKEDVHTKLKLVAAREKIKSLSAAVEFLLKKCGENKWQ